MRVLLCSVLDRKVEAFMPLFPMRSKGEAIRSFMDACKDEKQNFARHPDDFALFQMGTFDDQSGAVEPCPQGPVLLFEARDCMRVLPAGV